MNRLSSWILEVETCKLSQSSFIDTLIPSSPSISHEIP